jgi:hypothetical protein
MCRFKTGSRLGVENEEGPDVDAIFRRQRSTRIESKVRGPCNEGQLVEMALSGQVVDNMKAVTISSGGWKRHRDLHEDEHVPFIQNIG